MIDENATFGFESEWAANYRPLVRNLYENDYLPDDEPHSYHCDCDGCNFENGDMLKAQRDSSCDGEIISAAFFVSHFHAAQELMTALETAAFLHDAEPGIGAGFHVHARTAMLHLRTDEPCDESFTTFLSVLLTLPGLRWLGSGRHLTFGNNNHDTLDTVARMVLNIDTNARSIPATFIAWANNENNERELWMPFYWDIVSADRHGHVNWRTRYDTIEFRLFRSTRMAWRMELYCLLAALSVSPNFNTFVLDWHRSNTMDNATFKHGDWFLNLLSDAHAVDSSGTRTSRLMAHLLELCQTQCDYIQSEPIVPAGYVV